MDSYKTNIKVTLCSSNIGASLKRIFFNTYYVYIYMCLCVCFVKDASNCLYPELLCLRTVKPKTKTISTIHGQYVQWTQCPDD